MITINVEISNPAAPEKSRIVEFLSFRAAQTARNPLSNRAEDPSRSSALLMNCQIAKLSPGKRVVHSRRHSEEDHAEIAFGNLGLALDPLKRELRPLPMILA